MKHTVKKGEELNSRQRTNLMLNYGLAWPEVGENYFCKECGVCLGTEEEDVRAHMEEP